MFVRVVLVCAVLAVGCRPGSPVSIDDPPLAERLDERRAAVLEPTPSELNAESDYDSLGVVESPPASIALADTEQTLVGSQPIVAQIVQSPLGVKLRTGPGPGYGDRLVIPADAIVNTTGNTTGEWAQVRYGELEGWVPLRVLEPSESETGDTIPTDPEAESEAGVVYKVAGTEVGVNLRARPDKTSELVSGAPVGSTVVSTGNTEDEWVEVEFNGVTGWAFGGYLVPSDDDSDD